MPPLITVLEVAIPALIGIVAAAGLGFRQVRALRKATGDDSALTSVLSGEMFRHDDARQRKAA